MARRLWDRFPNPIIGARCFRCFPDRRAVASVQIEDPVLNSTGLSFFPRCFHDQRRDGNRFPQFPSIEHLIDLAGAVFAHFHGPIS